MMALRITQRRSAIGRSPAQRETLKALGLRRVDQSVEHPDEPTVRGMLTRVEHLVSWERVDDADE